MTENARVMVEFGEVVMVPKAGVEPARPEGTTPSRWRVCQFRHFGTRQLKISINTREKIN